MTDTPLVRVTALDRDFGPVRAVREVSFELNKGDVLGFLGPNGAGKTTTMRILAGNLAPTAGGVEIAGVDLLDQPIAAKRQVGYLPEHPPVLPELTVDEYLRYCGRLNGIPRARLRGAVDAARERTGIAAMGNRVIGNLSRGFRQRVGIAQAIIHQPEVVILDEPTIGLDPIQVREIRDLIRQIGEEHGVILSTHILPEVQAVCNRVQIIHEGRLVFSDTLEAVNRRLAPTSLRITLNSPPAAGELEKVPGVQALESLGAGEFRIRHEPGASPAETLAEKAVAEGWRLAALVPESASLEQIFVELTATEASDPDSTEEAA